MQITVKEGNTSATNSKNLPEWINSQVVTHSMNIGNTTNTAQVSEYVDSGFTVILPANYAKFIPQEIRFCRKHQTQYCM